MKQQTLNDTANQDVEKLPTAHERNDDEVKGVNNFDWLWIEKDSDCD